MKIDFKWIGAACFILEIDKQFKIACDPSLSPKGTLYDFKYFKSERTFGPEYEASDFKDVDLWLLTHNHLDHLDNDGISVLNQESVKLCHPNVVKKLAEKELDHIDSVSWGEHRSFSKYDISINVTVVPAVHGSNFITSYLAGGVNGYWLEIRKGDQEKQIYITGDTVCHEVLEKHIGNKICDVLIPNMGAVRSDHFGGPLTMNSDMLSHMIDCFEPLAVLPIHYGCFTHYTEGFPELDLSHRSKVRKTTRGKNIELTV